MKYPDVYVKMVGEDGNAFGIMGRCIRAARMAGLSTEQIDEFLAEATAGDYDHLLQTCLRYFDCD
jgi:hypothetical protein